METENKNTEKLTEILTKLKNKDFNLYFFTLDTKGNPTAGVANIYEHVKVLNKLGYNAFILHEKNDYKRTGDENGDGISSWLGEEYAKLPHASIEGGNLNISPQDFIIIPEIFSNVMDQVKTFPCKKIVFSQCYDFLLELLPIGKRWNVDYGFFDVITTSDVQAKYIKELFPSINTHVIPVSIPKYFTEPTLPKKPIIAIHTRNPSDATKIVKSFYLKYPIYRWVSFKDLRGLPRESFAKELSNCCLAVWVDDNSGFGTFPLECFETMTPVIGKIPNMIPEWMGTVNESGAILKENGIWTNNTITIPDLIVTYMKVWLEDAIPEDIITNMKESKGQYTEERQEKLIFSVYGEIIDNRIKEFEIMEKNMKNKNE